MSADEKQPLITPPGSRRQRYVLVIHGGAGTMQRENSTPEQRSAYRSALAESLLSGYQVLSQGGDAMDAAVCAVSVMEGGRTNKLVGRIGDTPLMGSGYWAEEWKNSGWVKRVWNKINRRGEIKAVGGTGDGDYFIRHAAAVTVARRVRYRNESLDKASQGVVEDLLKDGGIGGLIALDNRGNVSMPLNCPGMYRGVIREDGLPKTAIFFDEEVA
ncbi:hypothetical protein NLJ89_g67 [Agrocybe chaxingu]|uniref:Asparaginase n=1 Tax=Agrocybe chaxingu TaxID=84603 RepID=A0A9W8N2N2_9AGAR|nr:hypothetical protein NLJ89_g67 [Agrocybe chaxingu]